MPWLWRGGLCSALYYIISGPTICLTVFLERTATHSPFPISIYILMLYNVVTALKKTKTKCGSEIKNNNAKKEKRNKIKRQTSDWLLRERMISAFITVPILSGTLKHNRYRLRVLLWSRQWGIIKPWLFESSGSISKSSVSRIKVIGVSNQWDFIGKLCRGDKGKNC